MDPTAVDDALGAVSDANGDAFIVAHFNEANAAAEFGPAVAARDMGECIGAAADSATRAVSMASNVGISIQDPVSPDAIKNGAAPGTISVAAFSFTNGGSTYAVAPGANGTLVGTKDGEYWNTWQLTTPADAVSSGTAAATALQTLTSLTTEQKASADKSVAGIDVSA
jgi:hypothetical protein